MHFYENPKSAIQEDNMKKIKLKTEFCPSYVRHRYLGSLGAFGPKLISCSFFLTVFLLHLNNIFPQINGSVGNRSHLECYLG